MHNNESLTGKVALVTGGSRGIGRAIVAELASRGATVAFTYFRNHSAAQETLKATADIATNEPYYLCVNVSNPLECQQAVETVYSRSGRLDILVNNAASGVMRSATQTRLKHWEWTIGINARAPWLMAVAAAQVMQSGARIINVSSLGSTRVLTPYFAVGVSKSALEAVTRYLAIDLAEKGILVNTVSAGFVKTQAIEAFPKEYNVAKVAERPTPLGRALTTQDVAKVIALLCSDDASMITGQIVTVDGGESIIHR